MRGMATDKSNHASGQYPEISASSVIFGVISGVILNASMTYAGLKIGYTIPASTVAAILGFGILRGMMRRGSILEVNIAQSVASSVQLPCSGVIFTAPVLILLGYSLDPTKASFWWIALGSTAGAILGSAFIIPLRKQMIEIDRLRFPSGYAVAAILKSPGAGAAKSWVLVAGSLLAAVIYFPTQTAMLTKLEGLQKTEWSKRICERLASISYSNWDWRLPVPESPGEKATQEQHQAYQAALREVDHDGDGKPDLMLLDEDVDVGRRLGIPVYVVMVFAITPLSFGAGYLSGKPGLVVLAGGVLAYWLLNPLAYQTGMFPGTEPHDVANIAKKAFNRPIGIGMLLGGALMGLFAALPAMWEAMRSLRKGNSSGPSQELGLAVLAPSVLLAFGGLWLAAAYTRDPAFAGQGILAPLPFHAQNAIVALVGCAWMWFGGIVISQCAGMTDWSPISGMALVTIVLMMFLIGAKDVVAAVVVGAALCVSVTCASDMMQDLKTGQLIGARPRVQQASQLFTSGIGPIVSLGTILILVAGQNRLLEKEKLTAPPNSESAALSAEVDKADSSKPLPIGPGTKFEAQQAQALETVIRGVQGGEMPYAMYGCGVLSGIGLGICGFPGLGVLVGLSMYLPISYILSYGLGCIANMVTSLIVGEARAEEWGVPFASGLIVGESFVGIFFSLLAIIG